MSTNSDMASLCFSGFITTILPFIQLLDSSTVLPLLEVRLLHMQNRLNM